MPTVPRAASTAYRQAQNTARARAGVLSQRGAIAIERALRDYAEQLTRAVRALPPNQRAALEASRRAITAAADQLLRQLLRAVAEHRALSYQEVARLWNAAAARAVASLRTIPGAALGRVAAPAFTLAGAYEGLGSAAARWETRLVGYVRAAAQDADAIVRQALLTGVPQAQLASALRPYVSGAAPFHEAFGAAAFAQVRDLSSGAIPPALRGAATKLKGQADRIAYSEIWNARAEAEVAHFAADPLIEAVQWTLAANRGSLDGPDVCDVLASNDFYGLGPGVYPLNAVPLPPHPWDRCSRVPVLRPPEFAAQAKPTPTRQLDPARARLVPPGRGYLPRDMTAAKADRIRAQTAAVLAETESHAAQQGITRVMQSVQSAGIARAFASTASEAAGP